MSATPITDLTIQDITQKGPVSLPGWHFLSTDLNASVGGDFIYLGYKLATDTPPSPATPVTNLTFEAYDKYQGVNPKPDWIWIPTDLNRGAKGKYIYTFYKKGEPGRAPITGIMFIVTNQHSPYQISGWTTTGVDLNKGAGGQYIWAYYSTIFNS